MLQSLVDKYQHIGWICCLHLNSFFHCHNPSGRTMALGMTQPLTEMSTRNTSWGVKAASAYGWQPYHLHVLTVLKSMSLNLLEPSGSVQVCTGTAVPFTFNSEVQGDTVAEILIPVYQTAWQHAPEYDKL